MVGKSCGLVAAEVAPVLGARLVTVYRTITGYRDGGDCVVRGAGSWGCAKTVPEARAIAKAQLRQDFGTGFKVKETVEWQTFGAEGWRLDGQDPPMQVIEGEAGVDPFFVEIAPGLQVMRPDK